MIFKKAHFVFIMVYSIVVAAMYIFLIQIPPLAVLGDSFRIFFFHFPVSILSFLSFSITFIASLAYLKYRNITWDFVAVSSVRLGFVFGALALITGWIFAIEAWGITWSWDPKVTTMLVLWFAYAGYLALRQALHQEEMRARNCAVYAIIAYIAVPLVYLSSRLGYSIHPPGSISLTSGMWTAALLMTVGIFVVFIYFLWYEVAYQKLQRVVDRLYTEKWG